MPGPTVVSRALAVLGCFDVDHQRLTLTEIAERADLPLTTAHRLVRELVTGRALARRADGGYEIGPRLWDLGQLAPLETSVRRAAAPVLQDLFAATHQTVHLGVLDGPRVLYVSRVAGSVSVPMVSRVGTRLPLHSTGVGKVLLAHAAPEVVTAALRAPERFTPATVVDPVVLARQLAQVRRDGFAITVEEMSPGASSVAVPVRAAVDRDRVVAALGLVVPTSAGDPAHWLPVLQVGARSLSRVVGRESG